MSPPDPAMLLWHDLRVAVLTPAGYENRTLVEHVITRLRETLPDPELVVVRESFNAAHPVDEYLRHQQLFNSNFYPDLTLPSVKRWPTLLEKVRSYATHLIIFWDGQDPAFKAMLETATTAKQPVRVVMIDRP